MPSESLFAALGAAPNFALNVLFSLYFLASIYVYISLIRQVSLRPTTADDGSLTRFGLPEAILAAALILLLLLNVSASVSNRSVQLNPRNLLENLVFTLAVVLFIVFFPSQILLLFAIGILFGVGYGLYYAVDWALACDTLPDRSKSAKDMGLFHVAQTLPQTIAPAIGGFLLDYFNHLSPNSGYRAVFASAIVFFVLGTVFVSRIRSVR